MKHGNYYVIRRPVISEKSTALSEVAGRYVFEVAPAATKPEIRTALEKMFNVRVKKVRTAIMPGKTKAVGRTAFKKSNWKKAIITLHEGQKIDFFDDGQAS